ncbi:CPBP family intramembrane metalloprotease [Streptomyces kanamyceticus]|uniref:CPBP family intramembrane metalloprotease n=2 Tax=Streptomyces kanamyceticus TaxID=1967 RepID=A0A5J6GDH4_STRKN|nr:CPBP family intramembrane glutamic endopeptidase [Streptomyces kanamyceticus]QEU91885.1 CPBP family intramembrane metalloprotease [Streptomyces kanamyceticus]
MTTTPPPAGPPQRHPADPYAYAPHAEYPPYAQYPPHAPYVPYTPYVPPPLPYHRLALITGRHQWWRPLAGTGLVLAGAVAVSLVVLLGGEIVGAALNRPTGKDGFRVWGGVGETGQALLSLALLLPVVLAAAHWAQRRPAGTLSSVTGRLRWGWLGRCALVGLPLVAGSFGVMLLLPETGGAGPEGTEWAGLGNFLLGLAMVCVLVPFQAAAEEYAFRGWLTQAVGAWCRSPWVAILPQALLFAAAHGWGTPWGFADLVVFGLVAGVLTVRTGGLEAAIGLHVLNNLLAMGVSAAIAGALASDETAADMDWTAVAVDVVMLCAYAAVVLWLARRREVRSVSPGTAR